MHRMNEYLLAGIVMIAIVTGISFGDIGTSYESGIYPWYLPIEIGCFTTLYFILGYLAGNKDRENNQDGK
jgi:hypothetical protein